MSTVTNSTLAFYSRSRLQMSGLREQAETLQARLATGERIARSSDDPLAASKLRTLQRTQQLSEVDAGNARRASEDLTLASGGLESLASDLIRVRELAVWAATDTIGEVERDSIASEIESLRLRILDTANGLDGSGNALFGGEGSGKAYELDATGAAVYVGTGTSGMIDLGQGQSVTRGFTGPEVFEFTDGGVPTDVFAFLANFAAALRGGAADPAVAARDAMSGLDEALETATRAQTVAGSRIAWLDIVQERQVDQSFTRSQQIADTGGVDFSSTIAELQQLLTVLEASQASFARLSNLSLFNEI